MTSSANRALDVGPVRAEPQLEPARPDTRGQPCGRHEPLQDRLGWVVIGRNEGERLVRCLDALAPFARAVVYVDSGSTDGSVEVAHARGMQVVELDDAVAFTAARARNAGFKRLLGHLPGLAFVMFIDGDCEMAPGWPGQALGLLAEAPEVAAVCGRLRERFAHASIYNRLCQIEWDAPPGPAKACGGIAVMRVAALHQVGLFRPGLIAGEEPELCVRLRQAGWTVWRLDADMALHDAAMTRFGQWWERVRRSGYAFAEGAFLHGSSPERHWVAETRRAWVWGLGVPAAALAAVAVFGWAGLCLLAAYPLQVARLTFGSRLPWPDRFYHAAFLVLARFPEMLGGLQFQRDRLGQRAGVLIEYK